MVAAIVLLCTFSATGFCTEVPSETARQVAQGVLRHHVALFGHWNGSLAPMLGGSDTVRYGDEAVAFNFQVQPSGHVLVIVEDELSPVPLYSTTSTFVPGRFDDPNAIESWIVPELKGRVRGARDFQRRAGNNAAMGLQSVDHSHVKQAWAYFIGLSGDTGTDETSRSLSPASGDIMRGAAVAPLLATAWGQQGPYNLQTPDDNSCDGGHTLTGCVATAWAQVLNYWKWPLQGEGSYTYDWTSDAGTTSLSVDFSSATYDWANMPTILTDSSTQAQKDAVSLLMYHLGVAAKMDFGCGTSGSELYADEVLDNFFKFKTMDQSSNRLARENFKASQWFGLFKAELDADPPRPVIFSIFATSGGGHEVVVDGYEEGAANKVHINFGWEGSYDGYYDVSDDNDFNTDSYNWYVTNNQFIVVGIEPDNTPPSVNAGDDQSADEEIEVTLIGSATDPDPDSTPISAYLWSQISGPTAAIANATTTTATITTPNVHSDGTELVFQLRADDGNRAYGTDTVTITVSNTDGSVAPVVSSSGGGSSGGCFIDSLFNP